MGKAEETKEDREIKNRKTKQIYIYMKEKIPISCIGKSKGTR